MVLRGILLNIGVYNNLLRGILSKHLNLRLREYATISTTFSILGITLGVTCGAIYWTLGVMNIVITS